MSRFLARARPSTTIGVVAVVASLALLVGAILDPQRAAMAYLVAWLYWATLALGALCLVMIHHVTGSTWFIVLRRLAEHLFASLPLLALLFVPLLFAMELLYPWLHPETLDPIVRERVIAKSAYLGAGFFRIRALAYLGIWLASGALLARWSVAQEAGDAVRLGVLQKRLSVAALPAVALALTFASFDWVMSLSPAWASSVFGVYVFAGSIVGGLASLVVVSVGAQQRGRLHDVVRVSHYHGMGKLLLTFVVFWTYIAFFQFFIIWIANVPEEAAWYLDRWQAGWAPVSLALGLGHFVVPFLLLLSRDRKRRPVALARVALWLLAMHYVDVYWLVMPSTPRPAFAPSWLDLAAFLAIGGGAVGCSLWRAGRVREAARGDPRFERSLRFGTR
ncbi:MAG: hypothetical protein R3F35_17805 [Myxococcota bacterium]